MKYKMLVVDMDGTLLKNNKEVSEVNREAIRKAREAGVKFVISTGRIFTSAKTYAKLIGARSPIIASNGAYIRAKDEEEVVFEKYLDRDQLSRIVKLTKEYGLIPHVYTTNTVYSEKLIYSSKNYTAWNEGLDDIDRVIIEIVDDIGEIIMEDRLKFIKAVVMGEDVAVLNELRQKINNEIEVEIMSSCANNFEVTAKGTSKGHGVKLLADLYDIKKSEIICIGDSENDISMIKYAGLGVAMANAEDEVKKAARFVTDSNENDGVAKVIEKYILNVK